MRKKCLFFRKFGGHSFLVTPVLRFAPLPYYRRILNFLVTDNENKYINTTKSVVLSIAFCCWSSLIKQLPEDLELFSLKLYQIFVWIVNMELVKFDGFFPFKYWACLSNHRLSNENTDY